jgi:hypothetical protein
LGVGLTDALVCNRFLLFAFFPPAVYRRWMGDAALAESGGEG